MRKILFRGKRKCSNEWIEGGFHSRSERAFIIGIAKIICTESMRIDGTEVLFETVGQFTGLTDKNGKRIFEGDIVKLFLADGVEEVGAILYSDYACRFMLRTIENNYGFDNTCVFEVIGNIHDNPELLKGGAE